MTNANAPAGRHITSARNTAARAKPDATAIGRLRPSAAGADVPALGGRCGAAPRRLGSGRRGIPDGSVPMAIRAGSRRSGSAAPATGTAPELRVGTSATDASSTVGSSCQLSSPVGSFGASFTASAAELEPANDDHTSTSSVGSDGARAASIRGTSPVGGSVQCGSAPESSPPRLIVSAADSSSNPTAGCSVVAPKSGPPNSSSSNESISLSNGPGLRRCASSSSFQSLMSVSFPLKSRPSSSCAD